MLSDAISLPSVLALFDEGRVSVSVVILDACRDNPFVKKSTRSVGATRGLTVVQQSSTVEGSAVLFSTAPGDTAADGDGRNGIFTQALLKYLTTSLKLQDLATRVTGEVKRLTGGKQVPFNSISLSEDFYLVPAALRGPEPLSPAVLNAAALAPAKPLSVKNSGLSPLWKASLGWGSLAAGTLGVGLSSLGYWTVAQARLDYSAATVLSSQVGWDAANVVRGRGNLEFNAGFGLVAAALVAWLTPGALSFFAKVAP